VTAGLPPSQAVEAARKRAAFASQVVVHHSRLRIILARWADHERRRGCADRAVELDELSRIYDRYSLRLSEEADEAYARWDNLRRSRARSAK
jgi:hypothetical protein